MKNAGDARIYVMYYKEGQVLSLDGFYLPVLCGQSPAAPDSTFVRDDTGENISAKNKFYSELTGIYWVWKNTRQDITGICHYRRYFTVFPEPWYFRLKYFITHPLKRQFKKNPLIYTNSVEKYSSWILTACQTEEILQEFDIILPRARVFRYSIREHYERYHSISDFALIEEILFEKCPSMLVTWQQVVQGNSLYANNMFVAKKEIYCDFMEWWFGMLFEFERRCQLGNYVGYQQRILGFVAERLLTLWVAHRKPKVKELQLLYFKRMKKD